MPDLLALFQSACRIERSREVIVRHYPRRFYKRPVLQRLANRWYGMHTERIIRFRIEATPIRTITVLVMPELPTYYFHAELATAEALARPVPRKTKTYHFKKAVCQIEVTELDEYRFDFMRFEDNFWCEIGAKLEYETTIT